MFLNKLSKNFDEEKANAVSDNLLDTDKFLREEHGFNAEFVAVEGGLKEIHGQKIYKPEELTIIRAFRLEGSTDVDEMSVVYAIETRDGHKGWIADAYGSYASPQICELLKVNKTSAV